MPDNALTIEIDVDASAIPAQLDDAKEAIESATAEMMALARATNATGEETQGVLVTQFEAATSRAAAYEARLRALNAEMSRLDPGSAQAASAIAAPPDGAEAASHPTRRGAHKDAIATEKRAAYELAIATDQAEAEQYAAGSQERLAILRKELATAQSLWGANSKQYQTVLKQLNTADRAYLDQLQTTGLSATEIFINGKQKELQAGIQAIQQQTDQHRISAAEAVQRETALTNAIYAQELKRLDLDISLMDEGTRAWQRTTKERARLVDQQFQQIESIEAKAKAAQLQKERQVQQEIVQTGTHTITSLITGRQTLLQVIDGFAERGLEKAVEYGLRELVAHLGITNAIVAATEAGQQAEVAAKAEGALEGKAVDAAAGSASVLGDAHKAFAGAYAAVAGIPIIGPVLAPIAGATAYAAVAAMDIFSAEGGMASVPYDGAMIQAHAREMVLPASIAQPLRDSIASGTVGGAAGGDHFHAHFHGPIGAGLKPGELKAAVVMALKQAHREGAFA